MKFPKNKYDSKEKKSNNTSISAPKKYVRPTPVSATTTVTDLKDAIMQLIQINPDIKMVFYVNPKCPDNIIDILTEDMAVSGSNLTLAYAQIDDIVDICTSYFADIVRFPHLIQFENTKASFQCSCNKVYLRPSNNWSFEIKVTYHIESDPMDKKTKSAVVDEYFVKYTTYVNDTQQIKTAKNLGWEVESKKGN